MGFGIRPGIGCRHIGIHELGLTRAVVGAVGRKLDFETFEKLEVKFNVQLIGVRHDSGRGLTVVGQQPTTLECLVDIVIAGKAKGKVQSRGHWSIGFALTKDVAYRWHEQREVHRVGIAVAYRDVAWRYNQTCGIFTNFSP